MRGASWERAETLIKPADLAMSIGESKQIAAGIQAQMVSDYVDRHNKALTACRFCGQRVKAKGYYRLIFKSDFGKVPMRVRRVWDCEFRGAENWTFLEPPDREEPNLVGVELSDIKATHFGLVSPDDALSARDLSGARPEPRSDPNHCQIMGDGEGGSSKVVSVEWQVGERPSLLTGGARLADH